MSRTQQVFQIREIWSLRSLKNLQPRWTGPLVSSSCALLFRKGRSVHETKIWESPNFFFNGMSLCGIDYFLRVNV